MQCTLQLEVVLVTVFILFSVSARKLDSNGLQVNDTDILIVHLGNAADLLLNPTSGEQVSYDKFWGDAVKYGEVELEEPKTELMEMEEMEAKEQLGGHTMELKDMWLEDLKTELLEKEEMDAKGKLFGRRMKRQSSPAYLTYACEFTELNIECDVGNVIYVTYANYGRISNGICNAGGHNWPVNCRSWASFRVLTDRCNGLRSCQLAASNAIFGDPCGNVPKYLEVFHVCESGSFRSTSSSGQLISPNYPDKYGNYGNNVWVITAPEGTQIVLSFMVFELERNYDYLYIRDGYTATSTLLHKLTGDEHFADVVSSGNRLHITFTSDSSVTKAGFYISWEFKRSSPIQIVVQVAPKLRFDSKFGSGNKCFPSSAASYYTSRASGNNGRICNTDYNTMKDGDVPTYWRAMECGDDLHIAFWFFTGYQDTCFAGHGSHNSDWEHIVVKVEDYKSSRPTLGSVQFYQHEGWYTKEFGHYSRDGVHPIVYSGKNSHGSYHDDGGSGGCCYWEDFRNPGSKDQYMKTWLNLEELRRTDSAPSFMKDLSSKEKFEMTSPLERAKTYEMCMMPGCKGTSFKTCHTSGCAKSDVNAGAFF